MIQAAEVKPMRGYNKSLMNLLALETSTPVCSVALLRGDAWFARHFDAGQRHAELALDAVDAVLQAAQLELGHLSGIAYGEGPGSFTGLRIACGLVQGLALARSLPVVGVSTLAALAEDAGAERVIACLDARMGEVYHAAYGRSGARPGDPWHELSAAGVYRPEAVPEVEGAGWCGCGSGFSVFGNVLRERYRGRLAEVRPDLSPSAAAVLRLARPRFERGEGRDAVSAVPIYLRDKVAMKTKERTRRLADGRK
jgi:tRNA threonylcarbamoyladenosine biosynthesis protein TsaB